MLLLQFIQGIPFLMIFLITFDNYNILKQIRQNIMASHYPKRSRRTPTCSQSKELIHLHKSKSYRKELNSQNAVTHHRYHKQPQVNNMPAQRLRLSKRRIESNDTYLMSQHSLSNLESSSNFVSASMEVGESPQKNKVSKRQDCEKQRSRIIGDRRVEWSWKDGTERVQRSEFSNNIEQNQDDNLFYKKSYRKIADNKAIICIPFRKCQTFIEERIVCIINKIQKDKQCERQLKGLIEKTKKLSPKQLINKYVISGICIISKLLKNNHYPISISEELEESLRVIYQRILMELQNVECFKEGCVREEGQSVEKVKILRRVYKIMKRKSRGGREIRGQAIRMADMLIEKGDYSKHSLMQCMKQGVC